MLRGVRYLTSSWRWRHSDKTHFIIITTSQREEMIITTPLRSAAFAAALRSRFVCMITNERRAGGSINQTGYKCRHYYFYYCKDKNEREKQRRKWNQWCTVKHGL